PGGVPSPSDSNDLFCPADTNVSFEIKRQFPQLSSPRSSHALVAPAASRSASGWPLRHVGEVTLWARQPSATRAESGGLRSDRPQPRDTWPVGLPLRGARRPPRRNAIASGRASWPQAPAQLHKRRRNGDALGDTSLPRGAHLRSKRKDRLS